jgi:hypothetical protein
VGVHEDGEATVPLLCQQVSNPPAFQRESKTAT